MHESGLSSRANKALRAHGVRADWGVYDEAPPTVETGVMDVESARMYINDPEHKRVPCQVVREALGRR